MRLLLSLFFAVVILSHACAAETLKWERWSGCTLAADRFFDGDSFQIKYGRQIFVLRLYGADTPETDAGYGTRIGEQAAYFGISDAEVLRGGSLAKEFTARFLSKPFSVITRRKVAPGASRAERIYAAVERDGVRLEAALIQAGLARATTEVAEYPDATAGQRQQQELRSLEQKAAQEKKGLWALSKRKDRLESLAEAVKARHRTITGQPALPAARKVNLNTAAKFDLEALPGIGPKTADLIIRSRPLKDVAALDALPGFGPKKIEALRELVSFE